MEANTGRLNILATVAPPVLVVRPTVGDDGLVVGVKVTGPVIFLAGVGRPETGAVRRAALADGGGSGVSPHIASAQDPMAVRLFETVATGPP